MESKLLAKEIKLHLNKHLNNIVSSKANNEALMHGFTQVKEGKKEKTIKTSDLWK